MNITHICANCGEDLELTHDLAVYPDTMAISVTPCPKCLKSQAEDIAEDVAIYRDGLSPTLEADEIFAANKAIEIIEKKAGLS